MTLSRKVSHKTNASRIEDSFAQGFTGTNSKRHTQYPENFPPVLERGERCYVFDPNGKQYCDFISGLGSIILGYSNSRVIEAVKKQVNLGASFSLPTIKEIEVAEQLRALIPDIEKLRFLKTGNEASLAAIRIARAYTNRQIVLTKGYHGWGDPFTSLTPPALGVKDDYFIYQLSEDLHEIDQFGGSKIACIIVEAIELDNGNAWRDWLKNLRVVTKKHGIILIVDEIITGFRVPGYTASNYWSIKPDLVLLGKGIANGYPLSVIGGNAALMDSDYFVSSTFSGEAVSLAAAGATIEEIERNRSLDDLLFYGTKLQNSLNKLHPDLKLQGYGSRCSLDVTKPIPAAFSELMCDAGYLFGKAFFYNFAHLDSNIESLVIPIAEAVMDKIKRGYECKRLPQQVFLGSRK